MRLYKIRDISSGLYMEVSDLKVGTRMKDVDAVTWHPAGAAWETLEELEAHLRRLVEARQVVSPLWEVEVLDMEVVERYPAIVHAPRKS